LDKQGKGEMVRQERTSGVETHKLTKARPEQGQIGSKLPCGGRRWPDAAGAPGWPHEAVGNCSPR